MKCLIIGVGNPFRHDDGIGSKIIQILRQQPQANCDLLDGGTDGLALLDEIAKYSKVIIIDAVNMNTAAGTIRVFTPEEAQIKITHDALSTHGFGIAEVIKFTQELKLPAAITIIGIQPADISFGEGLSAVVQDKVPVITQTVVDLISNGITSRL